jgi:hypothetical protein
MRRALPGCTCVCIGSSNAYERTNVLTEIPSYFRRYRSLSYARDFGLNESEVDDVTAAKWTVFHHNDRWVVWPPYPLAQFRTFPDWPSAFAFADSMARGLA